MRRRRRADESTSQLPFWVGPAIALVLVLIVQALVVKLYAVPSGSMQETLDVGDRILVERIVPTPHERGDVIVFEATPEWGSLGPVTDVFDGALRVIGTVTGLGPGAPYSLVKRVIGMPGEEVACCDAEGRVTVDGEPLDEPYLFEDPPFEAGSLDCTTQPISTRCFGPIAVPEGSSWCSATTAGRRPTRSSRAAAPPRPPPARGSCPRRTWSVSRSPASGR
ncbi:signal peptidase I [Agromyces mangrovi Wang et al. 2018]|uniref:signal peptidase I n=1 Tax=Agromyces mangrovi TaxID=1858653 RepID=UPI00257301FB|nr:signal peptidase I [Agromyces mangrovi]BDZ65658.1 hypothetical protein GCM10025877_25960 [Agromyces mangrovi]